MKLYDLTSSYLQVLELAESGEDVQDTLESIQGAIEHKAEGIAKVIRTLDAQATAIKAEEQRLNERRKSLENNRDSLKRYLENQLHLSGMNKVKGELFTVYMQNNPPSVEISDESLIPETFVKTVQSIDRKAIIDALKQGQEVPGAALSQGQSIRIK